MANVMSDLDEIIEHVLNQLPMIHLQKCARVCKRWNGIAQRLKRSRRQPCWLLYHRNSAENLEQDIQERIHLMSIEPRFALVFCSTSLQENMVAVTPRSARTSSRHPRAAKLERMLINDYLQRVLPPSCVIQGTATDGIIGTGAYKTVPAEFENCDSLSCLLLPELSGVEIHTFRITPSTLDRLGPPSVPTDSDTLTSTVLSEVTGIPEEKKPKLLLMFQTEAGVQFNKDIYLYYPLLRAYRNIVIAGGYVDSFIPEDENETDSEELNGLGIAFMGDHLKVASVLIGRRVKTKQDVEHTLKKLQECHVPSDNAVGFMFTCIGRGEYYYGQNNVESSVFHTLFPSVPLLGFFGNGENGYDYLPDYSSPEGDSNMSLTGRYPDDESGYVMDMPPIEHSYSTVFVLMSFGATK